MSNREEWLQSLQNIPQLVEILAEQGKTVDMVESLTMHNDIIQRQPNYLAAISGDKEEAAFIKRGMVEYIDTGWKTVEITLIDGQVFRKRYYAKQD